VLHEPDGIGGIWSPQWYLQYGVEKQPEFAPFLDDVTLTSRCVTSILINNFEGFASFDATVYLDVQIYRQNGQETHDLKVET
jgi:hypothetical protein